MSRPILTLRPKTPPAPSAAPPVPPEPYGPPQGNAVNYLFERIRAQYPDLFKHADPKPLAIGIFDELRAAFPYANRWHISAILRQWTQRTVYARCLRTHSHRYHLDGTFAQPIATEFHMMRLSQLLQIQRGPKPRPPQPEQVSL
jgi:hypothetical protein